MDLARQRAGPASIELAVVCRPNVFDLVLDLMGLHIVLGMPQAIVRGSDAFPGYTRTDGGEALRMIRVAETSWPLAMKAMYLLKDVEGAESGNFTVFPGSHLRQIPFGCEAAPTPHTPGAPGRPRVRVQG